MLSYVEFLLENKVTLKLYLSKKLREVLEQCQKSKLSGYKVAEFLLQCHNNDEVESEITYIDITEFNDKVSFIQSNRVKKFHDMSQSDDNLEDWSFEQWDHQEFDILTNVYTKQRDNVSIGKFANKIYNNLNKTIIPKDLEDFVNLYKSSYDFILNPKSRFELVNGQEIKKWYYDDNYDSIIGELSKSCMRFHSCQEYFDIYTENPEVVSLLILKSSDEVDKITGRALIWKTTSGDIIMDKIYTNKNSDTKLFEQYALDKGWLLKSEIKYSELEEYEIKLKKWRFDKYPFLDTFAYLDVNKGILSADDSYWPEEGIWKLQETGGRYLDDSVVWSEYNSEYISQDEAAYCERRGEWIRESDAIWLEYKDEYAHPWDDVKYSKYDNWYYYEDDVVYSDILESYIFVEESIEITINSNLYTDYIHKDFEKDLVNIVIGNEKYKTLEFLTMVDPITDEIGFKKEILPKIKDSYDEVSDKELENYLKNVKIEISDYKKTFSLLQKIGQHVGFYLYDYSMFNENDLIYLMRTLLITSPRKYQRTDSNILNNLRSSKYFENISDKIKGRFFLFSNYAHKTLKFGESIIDKIIKDPKMLSSYLKKKGITSIEV